MISLKNVSKTYGTGLSLVYALKNVSLDVKKGEFVSIVGQSGSGKSTLMNILGCLDVATSGSFTLMGEDVSALSHNRRAVLRNERIGFIFQGFHLAGQLSALENVELPLIFRGVDKKTRREMAVDALTAVGLADRLTHKPCELSGGQQQRVAVARALCSKPPIILADEPTGNLDSESSKSVLSLIEKLHGDGHTIILITHDLSVASKGQRTLTMTDGFLTS